MNDPWTDRLSEYLDGELSPADTAELEKHLAGCTACREIVAGLRDVGLVDPRVQALWKDLEEFDHQIRGIAVTVRYVPHNRVVPNPMTPEEFAKWEGQWYSETSSEPFVPHIKPGTVVVIDASGADQKGRGQANLGLTLRLFPEADGKTRMQVTQDIQLSGAAAQYGRGMIGDVSQILMRDFATNMQARLDAFERGVSPDQVQQAKGATGLTLGLQAAWMALKRVARRFFLPYEPSRV